MIDRQRVSFFIAKKLSRKKAANKCAILVINTFIEQGNYEGAAMLAKKRGFKDQMKKASLFFAAREILESGDIRIKDGPNSKTSTKLSTLRIRAIAQEYDWNFDELMAAAQERSKDVKPRSKVSSENQIPDFEVDYERSDVEYIKELLRKGLYIDAKIAAEDGGHEELEGIIENIQEAIDSIWWR
jgi:hypothetical protein